MVRCVSGYIICHFHHENMLSMDLHFYYTLLQDLKTAQTLLNKNAKLLLMKLELLHLLIKVL